MNTPSTQVLLVEDFGHQRHSDPSTVLNELRTRLEEITGVSAVEVTARGLSSAVAVLPAKNQRESDRLKDLLKQKLDGWTVVEAQQYRLPQTF
jgi:hypothetical protein